MMETILKKFESEKDPTCLNDALVVLKGVAITSYSRSQVAELHGEKWLAFLEVKAKKTAFKKYATTISTALYKNEITNEAEVLEVLRMSQKWIKVHA